MYYFRKKGSKYNNNKISVDNIKFDSKKEAKRYSELILLQQKGFISCLELQPKFELQPTFKKNGETIRAINYKADFRYFENGQWVVEDAKGFKTKEYLLKKKMFEYKFPNMTIKEV